MLASQRKNERLSSIQSHQWQPEFTDEEHRYFNLINSHLGKVITAIERIRPVSTALTLGELALEVMQIALLGVAPMASLRMPMCRQK
ncbi:hypothetical protein [Janthinobacterium aquaticum]|uniref:hypothetical protein n=1 Tax=Janthinobacterium sp. FT58W TaxID=2654254 RepID=UPI0012641FA0|nr:hypothetical protein [Janthinobacterium sp. FT58W]KAB8045370.1 hypothetical protein GCM43_02895 [Janthinobacterium sp. FT58W]